MRDAPDELGAYIKDELADEWQRKSSFESRSLALIAGNVGLTTLFFAVVDQLELSKQLEEARAHELLLVAMWAIACSTLLALLGAAPISYKTASSAAIEEMLNDALDGLVKDDEAREGVLRARMRALKSWRIANGYKVVFTFLSLAGLAVAAASFAAALLSSA